MTVMRTAVCRSLIQDRPDTRIHSPPKEDKSLKRSEDISSERVTDREGKKKSSKTEIEVVRRNTEIQSESTKSSKSVKERRIVEIVKPETNKSKSEENERKKEKDEKSKSSKPIRPPLPSQSEPEPTSKSEDISQKSKPVSYSKLRKFLSNKYFRIRL